MPKSPPASTPNSRPNPKSQNSDDATRKLAKFLIATLIEFFDRTRPLSSAVNPACMNSTSAAQSRSQPTSRVAAVVTAHLARWPSLPFAFVERGPA